MKTIVLIMILLPLVSFGQNDSSRLNYMKNYIDYLGEDSTQAFFWNGTIARCPIPSPLFNSLDSLESEVIVVIMYMPMRYEEIGELNKKRVRKTIENIKGGKEEMYFLGFDFLNKRLDVYTCDDYLISIPIRSYRKGSNKLIITTEDVCFSGRYDIRINKDRKVICNVYDKRNDKSEILYSTVPEFVQINK